MVELNGMDILFQQELDLMFLDIVRNAKNASSDAPKYMAATDKEEPPEQKAALGTFPMIAKLMKEADKTEGE